MALWQNRLTLSKGLEANLDPEDMGADLGHVFETIEAHNSAARKLGGDLEKKWYGAAEL